MKTSLKTIRRQVAPAMLLLLAAASSCNSKEKEKEEIAVTVSTVAVKDFTLTADDKVLSNLDSVFFSIDLQHGVIYNADSLPKGTDITKLIPVITFTTTMSEAQIIMEGGTVRNDTVDYLKNPTDSIDFSGNVKLNVTAWDKETKFSYRLKVNVHEQKPDSMMWDKMAVASLPSRSGKPALQKTVAYKEGYLSLVKEGDGSITLASTSDLETWSWTKKAVALPSDANIGTLTATPSALYLLDSDGNMYSSEDGDTWNATGCKWVTIIGAYGDNVLGTEVSGSGLVHVSWPGASSPVAVARDFPVEGRSSLVSYETKWTPCPTVLFAGGKTASGEFTDATWAYDGSKWTRIDNKAFPAISGASLFRYVSYVGTTDFVTGKAYDTLYLLGGTLADGAANRNLYISRDNGVTWLKGSVLTDLPEGFPKVYGADVFVEDSTLEADLTSAWSKQAAQTPGRWLKPSYTLDGYDISWKCPYIYIMGGQLPDGSLSDAVWRGVMARLSFTPLI